jgi:nitrate reductase beta subunit
VSYTPKKKPIVTISWEQEVNKKVGVKLNAVEIMYGVFTLCNYHTLQNCNMKKLANKLFENMSVGQMFGNGCNKPKLKSLRSYNQTEFGDFFMLFGFLVTSRNKDKHIKLTLSVFICVGGNLLSYSKGN